MVRGLFFHLEIMHRSAGEWHYYFTSRFPFLASSLGADLPVPCPLLWVPPLSVDHAAQGSRVFQR